MTDQSSIQVTWDVVKKFDEAIPPEYAEYLLKLVLKQHVQVLSNSCDGEVNVFDEVTKDGIITVKDVKPNTKYTIKVNAILNFQPDALHHPEFKVSLESLHNAAKEQQSAALTSSSLASSEQDSNGQNTLSKKQGRKKFWSCNECDKVFSNVRKLNAHRKAHIKSRPYSCDICHKAFAWKSSLITHTRKSHDARNSDMTTVLDSIEGETQEFKTEASGPDATVPKYESALDDKPTQRQDEIKLSKTKEVVKKRRKVAATKSKLIRGYDCDECGKTFVTPSKLDAHQAKHRGDKTYSCDVCHKRFAWGTSLLTHKRKFHANFKPFECQVCHKTFQLRSILNSHSKIHTNAKSVSCSVCHKAFVSLTYLKYHMRLHTGEKPYVCDICNTCFVSGSLLNYHKAKKHGEQRPYKCNVCKQEFLWQKDLFEHEMEHIGDHIVSDKVDKPFRCRTCGRCYSHRRSLRKHAQTHTSPKTHMCEVCGKAFFTSFSLKSHQVVHSTATPYKCTHCPKEFSRSIGLKLHLTTHTGEKCFICEVCGKAFANSSNLKAHTIKHSGLKPFKCELCEKRYTDRSHLIRHRKKVHPLAQAGGESRKLFPLVSRAGDTPGGEPLKPVLTASADDL